MRNAKRIGAMDLIPDSWQSDGSLKRSRPSTVVELRVRAERARGAALEAEFREISQLARQRRGDTQRDRHDRITQASRMAAEARARGDWRGARTWDRVQESEAIACAMGL
jgi:hypothetical protein